MKIKTEARTSGELDSTSARLRELEELELRLQKQASEFAQEELAYRENNLIEFFEPFPWQIDFIRHAECSKRAVFAGNRSGKTEEASAEDVSFLLGERRFFPVGHPLRRLGIPAHGVKILVIAEDWDKVGELFTNEAGKLGKPGKIMRYLPSDAKTTFHRNQNGIIDQIYVEVILDGLVRKSGVFFDTVKSFKNNPKSFESSDWDIVHYDEPVPEDLHKAVSRGLIDRKGKLIALLTPLSEPWLYYLFAERAPEGEEQDNLWWKTASIWDNPTLSKEDVDEYFKGLSDPAEIACRESGRPLVMGNLVISTYDEARHLWSVEDRGTPFGWKDAYTPPEDYTVGVAIDTHPQTPTAVLFVAIAPQGQVFFYDELWIGDLAKDRISEVAKEINSHLEGLNVEYILCEPAAWVQDPETGRCFADVFFDNNLCVQKASKERTSAIKQTRSLFASDRKVFVMSHCRHLRSELKKWSFTKENKPADRDDHFCEDLGRLVVHDNLVWVKPRKSVREVQTTKVLELASLFSDFRKMTPDDLYALN